MGCIGVDAHEGLVHVRTQGDLGWVLPCPDLKGLGAGSELWTQWGLGPFVSRPKRVWVGPSMSGPKGVRGWVLSCPNPKGVWVDSKFGSKRVGFRVRVTTQMGLGLSLSEPKWVRVGSLSGPKGFGFGVNVSTQNGLGVGLDLSVTQMGWVGVDV
ncbi:hypothetical protein POTOM_057180 [Populus tomentosa]|uniref:Uncharacterized protein n=1 Tax=Populus tomentosa TaxID=118781 RepID=A0A8X8C1I2_POPTO|nr:hypothetical protein POTOM_057180 [Populus tomentosa]